MLLHFANQVTYANIYVLSLVYLSLLWCLETVFLIKIDGRKDFMF